MKKCFKNKEWVTPNRMKFDSGYKTFDRQVDLITSGNVISRVQHSSIIRASSDTNGGACKPGECRRHDIMVMNSAECPIPSHIMEWLNTHNEDKVWLYNFRYWSSSSKRYVSACWVITDYHHDKVIVSVVCRHSCRLTKSVLVLDEAIKYIVKGDWD